ncbi:hypothetical protein [Azospirillum isscasi]|uniref:Uncharacterized protein n=1 Tax=Azospirillum isscasi TaxID=3053926 RepID=A0ABU0WEM8_9PROT|nr:hypothetical protein [Azospirillum isscasi]MDQ2102596.1 hypothetical protein [Azospirillum isscasi]
MPINSERELEQAVAEFQRLADAPAGSSGERRKLELDAEIKAFYVQHADDLRKGKPRHE